MRNKWIVCLTMASISHAATWAQNILPLQNCVAIGGGIMTGVGHGKTLGLHQYLFDKGIE